MAGFFQQFLKGTADGFLGSPYLKDYTHASKTFVSAGFANTPKFKWLFHVYFDINSNLAADGVGIFPSTTNHGLLVKSIDLPKFQIPLTELNQYNRKRYIQTKINYEPVRIVFHDDNANQIRNLWFAYYSYYYNDPSQPGNTTNRTGVSPSDASAELNNRNIYNSLLPENQRNWGYMGEKNSLQTITGSNKQAFFKSIKIFGFNQHNFALYQLINPIIENFSHDNYSYGENGTMENSMGIKYESVKYYEGALNGQKPSELVDRFAEPGVYDTELSPIARVGSNRNIMGQGGLVDSANGILKDITSGNILGAIQTAGRVSRTFKNSQQILQAAKTELVAGVVGAITTPGTARTPFNYPAQGTNTGPGSQYGRGTISTPGFAPPPVNVEDNTPIGG